MQVTEQLVTRLNRYSLIRNFPKKYVGSRVILLFPILILIIMRKNKISTILRTTKEANAIITKAGGIMIKSSFNTAKQIFSLYKDAGFNALKSSRAIVKQTVELTVEHQKEMFKTSGKALKDVAQNLREERAEAKKASKPSKNGKKPKEVSIDDLLA